MGKNHAEISQKQSIVQRLKDGEADKAEFRDTDVRSRINFTPVDDIFDDLWAEDIGGMFFSLVNLTMVGVILVSGYLWLKLDDYERKN